eukprot:CAMPEP_0182843056 /NCGR_PEP_ID=MMETSP0006_2-20121128/25979_1 /TAXON_ID=97485 /ORGANISM="Prymnesium parvum, Strain Texoma1" /LENGTH=62 /DNA_ID=CAMNT_0024972813 /DNA_START=509 /DNA_END=697 /DNA_ORIENTATION=-
MICHREHFRWPFGADDAVDAQRLAVGGIRHNEGGLLADAGQVNLGENAWGELWEAQLHDRRK